MRFCFLFAVFVLLSVTAFATTGQQTCTVSEFFPTHTRHRATITVVMDDMGVNHKLSARALRLAGPVTYAFLPYAQKVFSQADQARAMGHEVIVHMPMQASPTEGKFSDAGPDSLQTGLTNEELLQRIRKNLSAFKGYVGVNNHMGSAFTPDVAGMSVLMAELKKRDIFFLDSVTTARSEGARIARLYGVDYIARDVFIDHVDDPSHIATALKKAERMAYKKGHVTLIGHPRPATLAALRNWIPEAEKRGITFIPLSTAVRERNKNHVYAGIDWLLAN